MFGPWLIEELSMPRSTFRNLLNKAFTSGSRRRVRGGRVTRSQLNLDSLEERVVLNNVTWTGNAVDIHNHAIPNWSDFRNWRTLSVPKPGDDVFFTANNANPNSIVDAP